MALAVALPGFCALAGSVNNDRLADLIAALLIALLALRIGVVESGMFHATLEKNVSRGNFFALFTNKRRFLRYIAIIFVGIPVWYVIGIPFTHGDLANLIGATRQWVTVQLSRMQARGIIRYDRGLIVILNLRALDLELV